MAVPALAFDLDNAAGSKHACRLAPDLVVHRCHVARTQMVSQCPAGPAFAVLVIVALN